MIKNCSPKFSFDVSSVSPAIDVGMASQVRRQIQIDNFELRVYQTKIIFIAFDSFAYSHQNFKSKILTLILNFKLTNESKLTVTSQYPLKVERVDDFHYSFRL